MATFWDNPLTNNSKYELSAVGFIVLIVHLGLTLLYFVCNGLIKYTRRWRGMHPLAAGQLRLAAAQGNITNLELLLSARNFDIEASVEGFTPLHAACVAGKPAAVEWLLQHGANINAMKNDNWKDTALHYAAASGNLRCCELLVKHGADFRAKNFAGLTPRDYAFGNNHYDAVRYLDNLKRSMPNQQPSLMVPDDKLRPGQVFYNAQAVQRRQEADQAAAVPETLQKRRRALNKLCQRAFDGIGTPGTCKTPLNTWFRFWAVVSSAMGALYLFWRATRSLTPDFAYFYSIPVFTVEWLGWLGWIYCVSGLWSTIDRPPRAMCNMMPEKDFPSIDVFVVTYNETVDIVEPTVIAAMNMNWPADKLTVYVLDDGKREEMRNMALKLDFQCQFQKKAAKLCYICREKVKGIPHHAKAGNINHTLLKGGVVRGDYVLVLDADMLVHPDFLMSAMGHMYEQMEGKWRPKPKAGFVQIPQDFWNVEASDPMFHLNTFFFGPMLKGRDGVGGVSCAGTGVIFKRDVLVSIGGQSYGSITEDFNTSMHLLMSGFSTMYLDERLVFGMAPDDVPSTFTQRLRWAQGAVQVYFRSHPLRIPGLSSIQSVLFYDACASHFVAPLIIIMALVPLIFLFFGLSPIQIPTFTPTASDPNPKPNLWEFTIMFLLFYGSNRITLIVAFRDSKTGMHALWRSSQQAVWLSVNHLKAVWIVARTELPIIKHLAKLELGFVVTDKSGNKPSRFKQWWDTFYCVKWWVLYYGVAAGALAYFIVLCVRGDKTVETGLASGAAILWTLITIMLVWPPISTLLPRIFTDDGWKVVWRVPGAQGTTVGNAGTIPGHAASLRPGELPGHAASLKPGTTINAGPAHSPSGLTRYPATTEMVQLNGSPMSDGTPSPPTGSPLRRRFSNRYSQPLNEVAVPIPEDGYPDINHAADERVPTLMEAGAPTVGSGNDVDDLAALFYQLQHSMHAAANNPPPLKRYPTVQHAEDMDSDVPAFTVHQNIPTMDAMHNPAIAFDQSHTPGGLRRVQGIAPIDPAIDNAVQHFAAQQGALPTLRRQATQQWMSGHDAYAHGGEHFVTFGNDRRVALPLLQEALDYALKHATDEREQAELFAQCLLGGGVANLQRVPPVAKPSAVPSAPTRLPTIYDVNAPMQPLTPLAAAMSIAQAGAVPAGATAVTVAGSHKQLGANMVLGVPDFSARRRPPRSFWFPLVYGTLILGLVVVTILNIANVFT